VAGRTRLESAADAAAALEPVAGAAARLLFAVGLLGASLLAGAVLPLATAYAVAEVAGEPKGVNLDFRRARLFFGLFTAMIVFGAFAALIPGLPVVPLLVLIQVVNGVLLPVILFFMLRLANDRRLVGGLANTRRQNLLGWGSLVLIAAAVLAMLAGQILR
jgi:Mn2+/Fe2+ NRAMP family transporter